MKGTITFALGQVVATPGALEALARNQSTGLEYIQRHASGDWGDVCAADQQANEQALIDGSRLLSAYTLPDSTKLWIITDAVVDENDTRPATTLLLPDEY